MRCKYQNGVKFGLISKAWNKIDMNSPETWLHTVHEATCDLCWLNINE